MPLTRVERYLAGFHDANPGVTSRAFGPLAVSQGSRTFESSYHALAAALPQAETRQTILDLACGDGHLLALLAATSPRPTLIGVDLSAGELSAARMRLGDTAVLHRGKAQQLALASSSVDAVTSHMALMLMDDIDHVFAELRRVLRPGGHVVAVVGASSPPSAALDAFIRIYKGASQRPEHAGLRFGDRRFRTEDGIRELLAAAAFEAVTIEPLQAVRSCTPTQLWAWFRDMYDTDLLTPTALVAVREAYLQALRPLCDASGELRHESRCLLFTARPAP